MADNFPIPMDGPARMSERSRELTPGVHLRKVEAVGADGESAVKVFNVTLALDTAIYADGDVLSVPVEIQNFFPANGVPVELVSLQLLDQDDLGIALDVLFLTSTQDIGARNAANAISDAEAEAIAGVVRLVTGDYVDFGAWRLIEKDSIRKVLKGAADSRSVWLGTITRGGTPTYTAAGIKLKIGIRA